MHVLVSLYRFALRSGNRQLAAELAEIFRRDPELREHADHRLQRLPRATVRWSAGGERAVRRALRRLGVFPP
jgi:hypothetical protein